MEKAFRAAIKALQSLGTYEEQVRCIKAVCLLLGIEAQFSQTHPAKDAAE